MPTLRPPQAQAQGDHATARALYEESLRLKRAMGDKQGIAESLEGLARIASAEGQVGRAAQLFGAAEALREAIGAPVPLAERGDHDATTAAARTRLEPGAFHARWAEGRAMTIEQAVNYALTPEGPPGVFQPGAPGF